MRETTWSKLRELYSIRRRCKQIMIEQQPARQTEPTALAPQENAPSIGLEALAFARVSPERSSSRR
jgi:hypothetical protein